MIRRTYNLLKPTGGTSGESPTCVSTPAGFFIGVITVKQIPLTQGKFAIVDDEDYGWLNQWKWCTMQTPYGFVAVRRKGKSTMYMHRLITGAVHGKEVDHKNHIRLDNRKANLRVCTRSQNAKNQVLQKNTASRYKGVRRRCNRWQARIMNNRKSFYLGSYKTENEAAKAYDSEAVRLFGEFAYLNFQETK